MSEKVIRICDVPGCGETIPPEDVKDNQVKFYLGDNPHFLGEVCPGHRSVITELLETNQK